MQLVDEEDDLAVGLLDLGQDLLETLLKVTPILGAGDQGAQVEGDDSLVLDALRDGAAHNLESQAFENGGLSDTRASNKDWVVLCPAGENLYCALDLGGPPDDGVQPALPRPGREVDAVLLEGGLLGLAAEVHAVGAAGRVWPAAIGVWPDSCGGGEDVYGTGQRCCQWRGQGRDGEDSWDLAMSQGRARPSSHPPRRRRQQLCSCLHLYGFEFGFS